MKAIGVGVGRTGTYSLKLALERLGLGPCHHMEEVLQNPSAQVPLWAAALQGRADWAAIYRGYNSTVDWPTAGFFRELNAAYPSAKFILTHRSAESWVQSFSATIFQLLSGEVAGPPQLKPLLEMAGGVIAKTGFRKGMDAAELTRAFAAHIDAVKAAIPADRLLVYQVKEGWAPLCAFLGLPEPAEPFPRSNDRAEFWDKIAGAKS
jgi:hypothetical protein